MREPPQAVIDDVVEQVPDDAWGLAFSRVECLPWGFGAWHWAASDLSGCRRWFVTADEIDHCGRAHELETTYAAALGLHDGGLRSVVPCLRSAGGPTTVLVNGFALSVTEWVESDRAEGPFADPARSALRAALGAVPTWLERQEIRAAQALEGRYCWVVTHGKPGLHNQLFDPHWRLEEIGAHAAQFRLPHTGGDNDTNAPGGLWSSSSPRLGYRRLIPLTAGWRCSGPRCRGPPPRATPRTPA